MNTERSGFIRKICEEPFEDTHRLVFADWLEESGEQHSAEFIRGQCAGKLVRLWLTDLTSLEWILERPPYQCSLLCEPGKAWARTSHHRVVAFRRGFVSHIELPYDWFMKHYGELFFAHPITSVKITDFGFEGSGGTLRPYRIRINNVESSHHLPVVSRGASATYLPVSFKKLVRGGDDREYGDREYTTLGEAEQELSAATVRWARHKGGLPQLEQEPEPARG